MSPSNENPSTPKPNDRPDAAEQRPSAEAEAAMGQAGPETAPEPNFEAMSQELALLRAKHDELETKLLRSIADYQTLARRAQQGAGDARQQQTLEMAKALIDVMDHFDRALEVDPAKGGAENLYKGVQMVRDEFLKVLERFGVKRLEVKPGEEFNPNRHQALMHQSVQGVPSNHVAAQLQPGYVLGEKTVRPAKVSVAS